MFAHYTGVASPRISYTEAANISTLLMFTDAFLRESAPLSSITITNRCLLFTPDFQRPLAERLRVLVLAPLAVQHRQVVKGGRHRRVVL